MATQSSPDVQQLLSTLTADEAKWIAFSEHEVAERLRFLTGELYADPQNEGLAREFAVLAAHMRRLDLTAALFTHEATPEGEVDVVCTTHFETALKELERAGAGPVALEQQGQWSVIVPITVYTWLSQTPVARALRRGASPALARSCASVSELMDCLQGGDIAFLEHGGRLFASMPVGLFARMAASVGEQTVGARAEPGNTGDHASNRLSVQALLELFGHPQRAQEG